MIDMGDNCYVSNIFSSFHLVSTVFVNGPATAIYIFTAGDVLMRGNGRDVNSILLKVVEGTSWWCDLTLTGYTGAGMESGMKKLCITAIALCIVGLFWWAVLHYLTLADIQRIGKQATQFTLAQPAIVFGALAVFQSVGMAFSLPTKAILTLLAGALLGTGWGSAATFLGVMTGTTALFFATRHLFRDAVSRKLGSRAKEIEAKFSSRPIRALVGLRLFITLPFGPITMAAALSQMKFRDFIMGTMIGDIPVIVAYAMAARQLFTLTKVSEALSPWTVGTLVGIGLFVLTTTLLGRRKTAPVQKTS